MDELLGLLDADMTYEGILSKTVILTLYLTGMRRAEILSLSDNDIDFHARQLKVTGKRNKQRIIPFGEELDRQLKTYLQARDEKFGIGVETLLVCPKGKAMTAGKLAMIVKKGLSMVTTQQKKSPRRTFPRRVFGRRSSTRRNPNRNNRAASSRNRRAAFCCSSVWEASPFGVGSNE